MSIVTKRAARTVYDEWAICVCDGCGKEAPVRDADYGRDTPVGWYIVGKVSDDLGVDGRLHACTSSCVVAAMAQAVATA